VPADLMHTPGASTVPQSASLEAVEFASLDPILCLSRRLVGAVSWTPRHAFRQRRVRVLARVSSRRRRTDLKNCGCRCTRPRVLRACSTHACQTAGAKRPSTAWRRHFWRVCSAPVSLWPHVFLSSSEDRFCASQHISRQRLRPLVRHTESRERV
jgi:hypothetical protein